MQRRGCFCLCTGEGQPLQRQGERFRGASSAGGRGDIGEQTRGVLSVALEVADKPKIDRDGGGLVKIPELAENFECFLDAGACGLQITGAQVEYGDIVKRGRYARPVAALAR